MPINPYAKYKEQSVMTMTQGEMVVKLYDEVINQLAKATVCINEKNVGGANECLQKCQKIFAHLSSTLDFKYEVSNNLKMLYDFFDSKLKESNVKKDVTPIEEITPLVAELKDAFAKGERLSRIK